MKKICVLLSCIFAAALFTSCDSKLLVELNKDKNSTQVVFSTAFSKEAASVLSELTGLTDSSASSKDSPFITAVDVETLLTSCGVEKVKAQVTDGNKITARGTIADIKNHPLTKAGILNNKNGLSVELNATTFLNLYTMLDEESKSYLDLLMAPVFTEEQLSEEEYNELLTSVYGDVLAKEISDSLLTVNTKSIKLGKLLTWMKTPAFSVKIADGK